MRKLLLSLACVAVATAASAQKAEKIQLNVTKAPVKMAETAPALVSGKTAVAKAPMKMAADGVYYKIPAGAMWRGAERPLYAYGAPLLTVAPWTELMFENKGVTKEGDWTIVTASATIDRNEYADEDNNLWHEYTGGLGAYYGITYTEGDISYIPSTDDGNGCNNVIDGVDFHTFFTNNVGDQKFYGGGSFENGNLYGAGKLVFYKYELDENGEVKYDANDRPIYELDENGEKIIDAVTTGVSVVYTTPQPMSPLYVEQATIWGMNRDMELPVVSDKTLTMEIYNLNSESDEPAFVLTCTPAECVFDRESGGSAFYQVNFTKKVLDEVSGEVVIDPFVIDFPAEIHISGFDQEGVNLGLMGTDVHEEFLSDVRNENNTFFVVRDDVTGELSYRRYAETVLFMGFWSMFDKCEVMTEAQNVEGELFENVNGIRVSNDGQDCGNVVFSNIEGVEVYTAMDWEDEESGEEMYWSDDMYDYEWIQNLTASPATYSDGEEMSGAYYVGAVCDQLPADVKGRYAVIHLNGRGVVSAPIYILQGDITMEEAMAAAAISSPEASTGKKANAARYNLAGQKVSKDYKGIVVKNGKAVVVK